MARPWLPEEIESASESVTLIEVVPSSGRASVRLEGERSLTLAELRRSMTRLPRGKPLVFVDVTGRLGYLARGSPPGTAGPTPAT